MGSPGGPTAGGRRPSPAFKPGSGVKTERRCWAGGITSWELALRPDPWPVRTVNAAWARHVEESVGHLGRGNHAYFSDNLPANQHWRLYRDLRDSCAFLDIETT